MRMKGKISGTQGRDPGKQGVLAAFASTHKVLAGLDIRFFSGI